MLSTPFLKNRSSDQFSCVAENTEMSSELFSGSANARIDDRVAAVLPTNYGSTPQATVIDARSLNGNLGFVFYIVLNSLTVTYFLYVCYD